MSTSWKGALVVILVQGMLVLLSDESRCRYRLSDQALNPSDNRVEHEPVQVLKTFVYV